MRLIIRILANSLAIYLAAYLLPGVGLSGGWKTLLIAGIVLSLINAVIKPILKLVSLPLIIITLGFFSLVINIIAIWLLTKFIPQFSISGIWAFVLTTFIVGIINWIVSWLTKKPKAQ